MSAANTGGRSVRALDGGSGRMFDGGEKGEAQTAGGSRSRLLERSRRVAGDADLAATDVAVESQNVDEGPGRVSFRTVREGRR